MEVKYDTIDPEKLQRFIKEAISKAPSMIEYIQNPSESTINMVIKHQPLLISRLIELGKLSLTNEILNGLSISSPSVCSTFICTRENVFRILKHSGHYKYFNYTHFLNHDAYTLTTGLISKKIGINNDLVSKCKNDIHLRKALIYTMLHRSPSLNESYNYSYQFSQTKSTMLHSIALLTDHLVLKDLRKDTVPLDLLIDIININPRIFNHFTMSFFKRNYCKSSNVDSTLIEVFDKLLEKLHSDLPQKLLPLPYPHISVRNINSIKNVIEKIATMDFVLNATPDNNKKIAKYYANALPLTTYNGELDYNKWLDILECKYIGAIMRQRCLQMSNLSKENRLDIIKKLLSYNSSLIRYIETTDEEICDIMIDYKCNFFDIKYYYNTNDEKAIPFDMIIKILRASICELSHIISHHQTWYQNTLDIKLKNKIINTAIQSSPNALKNLCVYDWITDKIMLQSIEYHPESIRHMPSNFIKNNISQEKIRKIFDENNVGELVVYLEDVCDDDYIKAMDQLQRCIPINNINRTNKAYIPEYKVYDKCLDIGYIRCPPTLTNNEKKKFQKKAFRLYGAGMIDKNDAEYDELMTSAIENVSKRNKADISAFLAANFRQIDDKHKEQCLTKMHDTFASAPASLSKYISLITDPMMKLIVSDTAICDIEKPNYETCKLAVKYRPHALTFVPFQTEELCLLAIEGDPMTFLYVEIETKKIRDAAKKGNPMMEYFFKDNILS